MGNELSQHDGLNHHDIFYSYATPQKTRKSFNFDKNNSILGQNEENFDNDITNNANFNKIKESLRIKEKSKEKMSKKIPNNSSISSSATTSTNIIPRVLINIMKTIYVENNDKYTIEIPILLDDEKNLTCGWLVSETIRKFTEINNKIGYTQNLSQLIALQTKDKLYTIDYWLTCFERPISVLIDKMILRPFFGDPEYNLDRKKINLSYFIVLKLIGCGGFSKVFLARRKDDGRFYAIKVISKKEMINKDKEECVFNEKSIMSKLDHPFIVKLHFTFQTKKNLYLVMDFIPGGELFYHLHKRPKLNEEEAKIYAGQIILCLNYLHKNDIIYRDLKPENILIDLDGHLHLADFGLAKVVKFKNNLNYSFCGSPECMAPEMISRKGYNFTLDYYSLGVFVYELILGCTPYYSDDRSVLFDNILHKDLYIPSHLSSNLKSFLSSILAKNPAQRLGAKEGLKEIINHPWCQNINYAKLILKKYKSPIVPDPHVLNFEKEFTESTFTNIDDIDNNTNTNSHNNSIMSPNIRTIKGLACSTDRIIYQRFANFSFYSNLIDLEAQDKYTDSIFYSPKQIKESKESLTTTIPKSDLSTKNHNPYNLYLDKETNEGCTNISPNISPVKKSNIYLNPCTINTVPVTPIKRCSLEYKSPLRIQNTIPTINQFDYSMKKKNINTINATNTNTIIIDTGTMTNTNSNNNNNSGIKKFVFDQQYGYVINGNENGLVDSAEELNQIPKQLPNQTTPIQAGFSTDKSRSAYELSRKSLKNYRTRSDVGNPRLHTISMPNVHQDDPSFTVDNINNNTVLHNPKLILYSNNENIAKENDDIKEIPIMRLKKSMIFPTKIQRIPT